MCHTNDMVTMQTSQLGQIEALKDRVRNLSSRGTIAKVDANFY